MSRARKGQSRNEAPPRASRLDVSDHEDTVLEAVAIAVALDLILEAGDHAGELDEEEVRAALRISAQLVTLTKRIREDTRRFFEAGLLKIGTEVGA